MLGVEVEPSLADRYVQGNRGIHVHLRTGGIGPDPHDRCAIFRFSPIHLYVERRTGAVAGDLKVILRRFAYKGTGMSIGLYGLPLLSLPLGVVFRLRSSVIAARVAAMDDYLLSLFQGELMYQCKFVRSGARQVNDFQGRDSDEVWLGLQTILVSSSNASKLLWGAGRTDEEAERIRAERKPLRESVDVEDSSPLNDRYVRNSFEHFDERIDRWYAKQTTHHFFTRSILPADSLDRFAGATSENLFGNYDPSTAVVTFWDRSTELRPVVAETERILGIIEDRWRRPMTFPP